MKKDWKAIIKRNLGLIIMGSSVVVGGILTATLVTQINDPWYNVVSINIHGGPSERDNDGNALVEYDFNGTSWLWNAGNDHPYETMVFARSIDGGDIPRTKEWTKDGHTRGSQVFVKWSIQQDIGTSVPSWISIDNKDEYEFGSIIFDASKSPLKADFYCIVSAELGGVTAYAEVLHVVLKSSSSDITQ